MRRPPLALLVAVLALAPGCRRAPAPPPLAAWQLTFEDLGIPRTERVVQAGLATPHHLLLTLYETKGTARLAVVPLDDARAAGREWPLPGAIGADAIAWDAARGVAYVGTSRDARVFEVRPGSPPAEVDALRALLREDTFVWTLAMARGRLYAGTFPGGRLLEYDPASRRARSLGQLLPGRQYVRALVAGASGTLYAGVGTPGAVLSLDPATGRSRVLLEGGPNDIPAGLRLEAGRLWSPLGTAAVADRPPPAEAGRPELALAGATWTVTAAGRTRNGRIDLAAQQDGMGTMGLGRGPDGLVYGATYYNASLFRVERDGRLATLGRVAGAPGEFRVLLDAGRGRLLLPGYTGRQYLYEPARPWDEDNPRFLGALGHGQHLAHRAESAGRYAAVVTPPDYGLAGGALTLVDLEAMTWETFREPAGAQSAVSVAWGPDGLVYVGTANEVGVGAAATTGDAQLVVFDPAARRVVLRATPVPGTTYLGALARLDARTVLGGTDTGDVFEWDVRDRRVRRVSRLAHVRDLVRWDAAGAVVGIAWKRGLFAYRDGEVRWLDGGPDRLLPGMAFDDAGRLYVHDGTRVWRVTATTER